MKKKLSGLDKYVIFSLSMILIYTVAEFISVSLTGIEKSTLTTCYFAVFGGEILSTALIKVFKLKEGEEHEDKLDSETDIEKILDSDHWLCDGSSGGFSHRGE